MKTKFLRKLVIARSWSATEKGERVIMNTLSVMCFAELAIVVMLIAGELGV